MNDAPEYQAYLTPDVVQAIADHYNGIAAVPVDRVFNMLVDMSVMYVEMLEARQKANPGEQWYLPFYVIASEFTRDLDDALNKVRYQE